MRRPLGRRTPGAAAWTAAVGRYRRALDRYVATVQLVPERSLRSELTELAGPLEAVLEDFEDAAGRRERYGAEAANLVLEHIRRAATLCAHATENALQANQASWRHDRDEVESCLASVRELVRRIDELGDELPPTR